MSNYEVSDLDYLGSCNECGSSLIPVHPVEIDPTYVLTGEVFVLAECSYTDDHDTVWATPTPWGASEVLSGWVD